MTCWSSNPAAAEAGAIQPSATPRPLPSISRTGSSRRPKLPLTLPLRASLPPPAVRGEGRGEGHPVYRIGIDVGGTFTGLVAVDDFGGATLAKAPSTPEDPSIGVLDGLNLLADAIGLGLAELLAETE